MPVQKIFWTDPYLTSLKAQVNSVQGKVITLDKSIIFAFSGGQQSDHGSIGGYPVLKAELCSKSKEIYYTLQADHTLQERTEVDLSIDWTRRYRLMRLHLAAELVLELVYQYYETHMDTSGRGSLERIGANIHPEKARLDFIWPGSIGPLITELAKKANSLIAQNLEIISDFSDIKTEKRYWEIKGFAKIPCGGTHLRQTGEIGTLTLKRNNIGKGKERIEIMLDR